MEATNEKQLRGYQLKQRIGDGGFGEVYLAHQTTVGREVAIKIIHPRFANHPEFIRRFETEAHLIARLEHPHITPLHDFWRDPQGAYLVMRYLRGGSVHDALKQEGAYELEAASRLLDQIASALDFAHRNEVIHRDIKPANMMLDEDGNAYLVDFGIAKDLTKLDSHTANDAVVGSLDYISPEQARSEPVTPPTDIYSLGVTLYEIVTGQHPFADCSSIEKLYKHISEPLPLIHNLPPNVGDAVNEVIQTATAKNPEKRYADVLALALAFREAIGRSTIQRELNIVEQLTLREHEILGLIVDGLSNQEIAAQLVVMVTTVKYHITHLYKKLGVRSRVQAIVRARELDLIVSGKTSGSILGGAASASISLPEPENPYRGLHAFQTSDSRDFFGREELTDKLISRMNEKHPLYRFLAIIGPSGSGKSSLVKAGLIPNLWRGSLPGSERWFVVDMLPGTHPLDSLETALIRVAANHASNLQEQLQRDDRGLLRVADIILPGDDTQLLIVVDQFEEVFTLVDDEQVRQHFLELLRVAVSDVRSRVRVVITLRADYYDRPLHYPEFGEMLRSRMETVLPLSAKGLELAIRCPAERVGVTFEAGLIAQIVSDMNYQSGALPLLQYALTELFDRREGRVLTHAAYQEIGGAVGALANRADEIYRSLTEDSQQLAQQMFLRLVTLGEGAEDTRRRATHAELLSLTVNTDLMEEIIDQFAAYRLLSLDHDAETRQPIVEVAHEAILREWDRLRQWLNESRDDIRQERAVSRAAEEWQQHQRDVSFLLRGSRLEQVEKWQDATKLIQTPLEQAYIAQSLTQRDKETQAESARQKHVLDLERRSRNFLRGLVAVFALATVVAIGLSLMANSQRLRAEDSEVEARRQASIGLAAQARSELENANADRAVLLALEALEHYPYTSQAESALADAIEQYRQKLPLNLTELEHIRIAEWSPTGDRVATVIMEQMGGRTIAKIVIWQMDTMTPLAEIQAASSCGIKDVAWSPDGDWLAMLPFVDISSEDSDTCLYPAIWDIQTGEMLLELMDYEGLVTSLDWSPDSHVLLTSNFDGSVNLWDATNGTLIRTLVGHDDVVNDAAFSPQGNLIATASSDHTARIWIAETGDTNLILSEHAGAVHSLSWSADGKYIATASDDGLVRLWDISTGNVTLVLIGHDRAVTSVDWSPNGTYIATASTDATIRVWNASTGEELLQLPGPGVYLGITGSVEWSPDSMWLAIGGDGQNLGIWNLRQTALTLSGHTAPVQDTAWSPDGTLLVSVSEDQSAHVWDAETGEVLRILNHPDSSWFFTWSPDSSRVAIPNHSGTMYVWDVLNGQKLFEVSAAPENRFIFPAWSPDGTKIVVTSVFDNLLTIWDAQNGNQLAILDNGGCILSRLAWSPNSQQISIGCHFAPEHPSYPNGHSTVNIWDVATNQIVQSLDSGQDRPLNPEWSADGTQIVATYHSGLVLIWDVPSEQIRLTFSGHVGRAWDAAWSPNGDRIVSSDASGVIKVWDTTNAQEVLSFTVPRNATSVHWSPDGNYVVASGAFNTPVIRRVWSSTQELISHAYECCVARELTLAERQQFGLVSRSD